MTSNNEKMFETPNHTQKNVYEQHKIPDFCSRHPDKKARYSINSIGEKKSERLCSKCALNEALKEGGINFELSFQEKFKRDNLEAMIATLEKNKSKSDFFRINLREKLNFLEFTHSQQTTNLNKLFAKILKIVTENQNEIQNRMDTTLSNLKKKIAFYLDCLNNNQSEIDKILTDISGNYQNIITEMKFDSFKEVLQLYQHKISEIDEKLFKITNENYEYFILEENQKQIQNLQTMDLQKLYSLFKKTTFLDAYPQENINLPVMINTEEKNNDRSINSNSIKKSTSKNQSTLDDTNRSLYSNPSSVGLIAKENSLCKSNQSNRQNISIDEKTHRKTKNSSIHVQMFVYAPPSENGSINNKSFKTERETHTRSNSVLGNRYFVKKK